MRADLTGVHSWVFRNRTRLRLIYGPAAPRQAPVAPLPAERRVPRDAGRVVRRARYVVVVPMPRRAG